MNIKVHTPKDQNIAEIISDEIVINKIQDALDIMVDCDYKGCRTIIIHEQNINPEFFNLRSGIAGEILQKFVNYKMRLAIVGDFNKYSSNSLKSFIIECNRGNQFFFTDRIEEALRKLNN